MLKDEVDLKANDSDVVKKTDIKTTLDENSTNDDVYGGKAIFDAIKKSNSYSTDEQLTGGTWIDGKPIYRKVVSNVVYGTENVSVNTGISNIATLINLTFIEDGITADSFSNYIYNGINRRGVSLRVEKNTGIVSTVDRSTGVTGNNGIFIIEYTKTTD